MVVLQKADTNLDEVVNLPQAPALLTTSHPQSARQKMAGLLAVFMTFTH